MAQDNRNLQDIIKRVAFSVFIQQTALGNARELRSRCDVVRNEKRHKEVIVKSWEKGIVCPDWRTLAE